MSETKPETPAPQLYCGNCGAPIPPKRHFCDVCLAPASMAKPTPPAPAEPAPPPPAAPAEAAAPVAKTEIAPPAPEAVLTLPQGLQGAPTGPAAAPPPGSAVPAAPAGPPAPAPAPAVIPVPPGKATPPPPAAPVAGPPLVPYAPAPAAPPVPPAAPAPKTNTWWIVLCVVCAVLAVLPLLVGCLTLFLADDMAARSNNTPAENRLISLLCCILPGLVLTGVSVFAGRRAARKAQ